MANSKDIVKMIMTKQEVTNAKLASRLSITPATLWDRVSNNKRVNKKGQLVGERDLNVQILNEMLRALDYKIIIAPADAKVPEGGYTL